jgi:medium-chain acyl-[acyl-carrier-protein] hydrolase
MKHNTNLLTHWYSPPPDPAGQGVLLLCFPYAGGGTWIFREWIRQLAPEIAVCAVKLQGRGDRFREAPAIDMRELARTIAAATAGTLHRPFAVFGHSMGALLAFEFVRELAHAHGLNPVRLIVSAAHAPSRRPERKALHALPDAEFIKAVQATYSHPHMKHVDPEVLDMLLPALRADIKMLETYAYIPGEPLTCPVSVFAGRGDPLSPSDRQAWTTHTRGPVRLTEFEGGHFFLHESLPAVLAEIRRLLRADGP